jgi:hypothetical protein
MVRKHPKKRFSLLECLKAMRGALSALNARQQSGTIT